MKRTLTVTTRTVSSRGPMMLPEDPSPAHYIMNAGLMTTRLASFTASSTTAMWANAVWGTRPASQQNSTLPPVCKSSAVQVWSAPGCSAWAPSLNAAMANFLHQAVKAAACGDTLGAPRSIGRRIGPAGPSL
jgi:hypothetical protein